MVLGLVFAYHLWVPAFAGVTGGEGGGVFTLSLRERGFYAAGAPLVLHPR